jgi:HlyD family secretion protein
MKFWFKLFLVLAVLAGGGFAAYKPASNYWKERNRVQFEEAEVTRGKIVSVVNATGNVQPVLSVSCGRVCVRPDRRTFC